jgi:catechol 2,3-dioxygenase
METKAAPSIAAQTGVGAVHLAVTDADAALKFYRDYVGLTPLDSEKDALRFGAGERELVVLHPGAARPVVPRTSGLYHLALLVPDRRELARVIARLGALRWDQYPTDHVMTKANYLWDPDGNGIEIYIESPEDGTMGFANGTFVAYDRDGRPRSGRDPIDLTELFSHLAESDSIEAPMPVGTKMGHVHLHVADVEEALGFYHDLVGFDVMGHVPGVGFVSAGGYHHHIGLNTWETRDGSPPPPGSTGLYHHAIVYPDRRSLADALRRVLQAGIRITGASDHGVSEAIYLDDPDGNGVELYRDRAPEEWPRGPDGELRMVTEPFDLRALLADLD